MLYKKGDIVKLLDHKLKIVSVEKSNYGYKYKLSCYKAGCCTHPYDLTLTLHEKDLLKYHQKELL